MSVVEGARMHTPFFSAVCWLGDIPGIEDRRVSAIILVSRPFLCRHWVQACKWTRASLLHVWRKRATAAQLFLHQRQWAPPPALTRLRALQPRRRVTTTGKNGQCTESWVKTLTSLAFQGARSIYHILHHLHRHSSHSHKSSHRPVMRQARIFCFSPIRRLKQSPVDG
jgi:hypothetical protein